MTINTVAQAREEEAALVAELRAKLPITLGDERYACGTFHHGTLSLVAGNTIFYICLAQEDTDPDSTPERYLLLVMGNNRYAFYWVEGNKENMLGDCYLGAEDFLDAFLHLYLSARYNL